MVPPCLAQEAVAYRVLVTIALMRRLGRDGGKPVSRIAYVQPLWFSRNTGGSTGPVNLP